MKRTAMMIVAMVFVSGCATQTYDIRTTSATTPTADTMQTFFVGGIGQSQTVDAAAICGGAHKVAKITTTNDVLTGAIRALQGIYTPLKTQVYCTQ